MRQWFLAGGIIVGVTLILAGAWQAYYQHRFPYGQSHCCDKQLWFALLDYADRHDGWFPRGEVTPEASLSLLYRDEPKENYANLLRGKTVPEELVRARLEAGLLLTPETCGWHYVEGLRVDDDPQLALFWDKVGLGHHGQRLSDGGHDVWFIRSVRYIPGDQWEQFLREQEQLRAELIRPPRKRDAED